KISSGDVVIINRLIQQIAELNLRIELMYARNPRLREDPYHDAELQRNLTESETIEADLQQRAERLVQNAATSAGVAIARGPGGSLSGERLTALQELRRSIMEKQVQMSGLQARLDVVNDQLNAAKVELGRIPGKEIILNRL